jgi:tRNA threonylcarbamoyladenosine biosynthesis protein TsaB
LLAIESATELVGVAVLDRGALQFEAAVTGRRQHAETLAPLVSKALVSAGLRPTDLDAVAVDVGPGLFTGLRVGLAMAKGLAFAARIGVMPVTSLHALARAALDAGLADEVVAVVDARRGEVFAARYRRDPSSGVPFPCDEPHRYRPEELAAALVVLDGSVTGPLALVGDGALRYADAWVLPPTWMLAGGDLAAPPPAAVARLAHDLAASGNDPVDPESVAAVYLRDADARINWTTRAGAGPAPEA